MLVRKLTPIDAKAYWELRLEALQNAPEAFLTTYEEAVNRQNPIEEYEQRFQTEGQFNLGAFENDVLVGMVTLIRETHEKLRHRANIVAMYVDEKWRGQGIAKELLNEAIRIARELPEVEQLYLSVDAGNTPAKQLYSGLGFKVYAIEERAIKFQGEYRDEEHMVLFL